jgi:DNA-binding MarR family transcriptional regulator
MIPAVTEKRRGPTGTIIEIVSPRREPPRSLLLDVYAAAQLTDQLIGRELETVGVTPQLFALLSAVRIHGPISPTDLAEEIGYPFTTLTDRLDRLVERGHIRREPNPDDRRSHLVSVTPDGEALARRAGPAVKRTMSLVDRHLQLSLDDVTRAVTELHHALRDALRP